MPKGKPLTADQLQTAAEVYGRTGSFSEAARAVGVDESAIRRRFAEEPNRAELHARATARGLRKGRKHLTEISDALARSLLQELRAGQLEPMGASAAARAVSQCVTALTRLDERIERGQQSRLTRAKTRADIRVAEAQAALLTAKANGSASPDMVILTPDDPRWGQMQQRYLGAKRQGVADAGAAEGEAADGRPDGGADPVA